MRLKKYEIRMSVSKSLHDRISQEAKYRDTKMANLAREVLARYYFQPERNAISLETSNTQQENKINKTIQIQIMQTEKKLFSAISKIEKRFDVAHQQTDLVVTMLDRFYFDIMKFLPNIPNQLILAAESIAHRRHADWLDAIKKIFRKR
jgi:hypothetical protein